MKDAIAWRDEWWANLMDRKDSDEADGSVAGQSRSEKQKRKKEKRKNKRKGGKQSEAKTACNSTNNFQTDPNACS
jgi:hypothetical protein